MFLFQRSTIIDYSALPVLTTPVLHAVRILDRDIRSRFLPVSGSPASPEGGSGGDGSASVIFLRPDSGLPEEAYRISITDCITITAGDDLGFVYGLLAISERWLGIKPFWFFLDQKLTPVDCIRLAEGSLDSPRPIVRFRGWFFNDEVLLMRWSIRNDSLEPWKMAFEALLRCGGNMLIPGTDKNSRKYRQLASDMGLWITHHHAEPLGAEMFVRAYPDKEPNYSEYSELFFRLWEEAVIEQKDYKVIWNLGFRGQGDCPFWSHDKSGRYNTAEKRGELISELIEKQRRLVLKHVKSPIFCTNLYGEIMELYKEGYLHFDSDIIKVYADNGYGKMVTRRQDNHSARVPALPERREDASGIYYHVSFYDLQAASHITMLPNSVEFVDSALTEVLDRGADDFWIINCSNVRPHVYHLDAIRKKWFGQSLGCHSEEFAADYYGAAPGVAGCLRGYADAMLAYGEQEDEHAGEQFYNENVRLLMNHLIRHRTDSLSSLRWLTGDVPLAWQLDKLFAICWKGKEQMEAYEAQCLTVSRQLPDSVRQLFDDTVLMQARLHALCLRGMLMCEKACREYMDENYLPAFLDFGRSARLYEEADQIMRGSEHGVWKGFYRNDCFADLKHTAYMLRKMMGHAREMGDNPRHDKWYREAVYPLEDRRVMTLLVNDNHMTDEELWQAFNQYGCPGY